MTISILELSRAIKKDFSLEKYIVLRIAEDGVFYLFPPTHFPNTISELKTNGYLNGDNSLTIKGKALLKEIQEKEVVKKDNFYVNLHKKLQSELQTLTGKKQKVIGGKYSFLCNSTDLEHKLSKVVKKYKLENLDRVEKLLLKYIHTCYKADFKMVQLLEYYVQKLDTSKLATDYFSEENLENPEKNTTFDGVNI